jgi:hypothetical protein
VPTSSKVKQKKIIFKYVLHVNNSDTFDSDGRIKTNIIIKTKPEIRQLKVINDIKIVLRIIDNVIILFQFS